MTKLAIINKQGVTPESPSTKFTDLGFFGSLSRDLQPDTAE